MSDFLMNSLRGGRLQFSCRIDYQDYTEFLGSVEGVSKLVGFDATPKSAEVTITLAGCKPRTLTAGKIVEIGLTETDKYDSNHSLWMGKIVDVATKGLNFEITAKGFLSEKSTTYTDFAPVNAVTPAEYYSNLLPVYADVSGTTPVPASEDTQNAITISAPTSTLGKLGGIADYSNFSIVVGNESGSSIGSFTAAANFAMIDFASWNTYAGKRSEAIDKSQRPMEWHWLPKNLSYGYPLSMESVTIFRADSARTYPCWWAAGYDQYFESYYNLRRGTPIQAYMRTGVYDPTNVSGPTSFWGWHQKNGEKRKRHIETEETRQKKPWTVGVVLGAIFGGTTTLITSAINSSKDSPKTRTVTREIETLVGQASKTSWWETAVATLGYNMNQRPEVAQSAILGGSHSFPIMHSFSDEVSFVNNQSFLVDPEKKEWTLTYGIQVPTQQTIDDGDHLKTNDVTRYQQHGTIEMYHPDVSTAARLVTGTPYQFTVTQTLYPSTIAVQPVAAETALVEAGFLGGLCAYESGREGDYERQESSGVDVASLYKMHGEMFEVPITVATINSWSFQQDNPLPKSYQLSFRDAYGDDYSYTLAGQSTTGTDLALNTIQGNLNLGPKPKDVNDYLIASTEWEGYGSPGCVTQHLAYCKNMNVTKTPGLVYLLDNRGNVTRGWYEAITASDHYATRSINNREYRNLTEVPSGTGVRSPRFNDVSGDPELSLDGPVLDVTPVRTMENLYLSAFSGNVKRKTYTATGCMAYAFSKPGDVTLMKIPDYEDGKIWLVMILGWTLSQGSVQLTVCPMMPDEEIDYNAWDNYDKVWKLVNTI